ncbi:hypothetical protein QUF58_02565 [Anaerolineales bacterium HSG24]|nr:hypothetical protein [Anaerolineales bacterium HSG24]
MADRDIGLEILEGIQEIKAYKSGKIDLKIRELKDPSPPQVIRRRLEQDGGKASNPQSSKPLSYFLGGE